MMWNYPDSTEDGQSKISILTEHHIFIFGNCHGTKYSKWRGIRISSHATCTRLPGTSICVIGIWTECCMLLTSTHERVYSLQTTCILTHRWLTFRSLPKQDGTQCNSICIFFEWSKRCAVNEKKEQSEHQVTRETTFFPSNNATLRNTYKFHASSECRFLWNLIFEPKLFYFPFIFLTPTAQCQFNELCVVAPGNATTKRHVSRELLQ